jgi:TetR/AcrR family transcriptional regulator
MQPTDKPDEALAAASPVAPAATRAPRPKPGERRVHILQTLASMLEAPKSEKVTTAALAARLGVSEAALYRHFASKAQMFEGLIEFIEQTLFGLINQITGRESNGVLQARAITLMLLNFPAKNPGMTRVLTCEALVGEHERLTERVNQMLERVEASLKQCLRLAQSEALARADDDATDNADRQPAQQSTALPAGYDPAIRASLLVSYVIGRWHRYVRSGFARPPAEHADEQLLLILQ